MEASFLPGEGKHDADLERVQIHKHVYKYAKTMEASCLPLEGKNEPT